MTPEQINIACAEEYGWNQIEDRSKGLMMAEGTYVYGYPPKDALIGNKQPVPHYHSDANAALELCEVMRKEGWWIQLHTPPNTNAWMVTATNQNPDRLIASQSTSLPAAICECFLRVKGKWVE